MHYASLFALALIASACSSKDSPAKPEPDSGAMHADAGAMHVDAGRMHADAGTPSALDRPTLPRPPAADHLPAELRPPR